MFNYKKKIIKIKIPLFNKVFLKIKKLLRYNNLFTVCEEALCPNILKCFKNYSITFIILGNICTRKCVFCKIEYGKPTYINFKEPLKIGKIILKLKYNFITITSVNRDDLYDKGIYHYFKCIFYIKKFSSKTKIEILIPDFKKKKYKFFKILKKINSNIINHNLETIPKLYKIIKPGSNYLKSLKFLKKIKFLYPYILTKSGIIIGFGENINEVLNIMKDMRINNIDILTIGHYFNPSNKHFNIKVFINFKIFQLYKKISYKIGFLISKINFFIRSSYTF